MAQGGMWEDQLSSISGDILIQSTLRPVQDDLFHILYIVRLLSQQLDLLHAGVEGFVLAGLVQVVCWQPKVEGGVLKSAGWSCHLGQVI